jgi:hypothetical protein
MDDAFERDVFAEDGKVTSFAEAIIPFFCLPHRESLSLEWKCMKSD